MEHKPQHSHRNLWFTILIVAVILLILFYFVDVESVLEILMQTDWRVMLVGAVILVVGFLINTTLYRYVLAKKPSFMETFHSDGIGYMVTMLSPIPGPALRIVALSRTSSVTASRATSSMVVYVIFGMIMRVLSLIIALLLISNLETEAGRIAVLTLIGLGLLVFIILVLRRADVIFPFFLYLLSRMPRVNEERVKETMDGLQVALTEVNTYHHILVSMLLSISMFTCFALFHYTGFRAMPLEISSREMFALAAAALVVLPPSAPATIGAYQGVLVGFLMLFQVSDVTNLTAYSILVFLVMLVIWIIFGVWGLLRLELKLSELVSQTRDLTKSGEKNE